MEANHADVIVLGVGSMGSAACYYVASGGQRVIGIEQFAIPHDQGSHAGQSRIIRKAYFEHPDYVPLLERAYTNWLQLEERTGEQVYFKTGLLYAGITNHFLMRGVRESAQTYNIRVDSLSVREAKALFPTFQLPDQYDVLFEPDAGFLTPERIVSLYVQQAVKAGAIIKSSEKVIGWTKAGDTFTVQTNRETYTCKKLIITAGPWAGKMIPSLHATLNVTRQVIAWVNPRKRAPFELGNFPCWLIADETAKGMYYGFPIVDHDKLGGPAGMKLAIHFPGNSTDPDRVDRNTTNEEEQALVKALDKFIPDGYESTSVLKTCLYTNTPDENFIIDYLPGFDKDVVIAAGFSGHGFKFAAVVGEVLSDMATKGTTDMPIEFLSAKRLI